MMQFSAKGMLVGAMALAGATVLSAQAEAMPLAPLAPAVAGAEAQGAQLQQVYWYGYRRGPYGWRGGWGRPYGWRGGWGRPYGWRGGPWRYGYGYRRYWR